MRAANCVSTNGALMRNNDEMERWRLGEIERELLEIAARARASTADHAAALMAEIKRIEEHCAHCETGNPRPRPFLSQRGALKKQSWTA